MTQGRDRRELPETVAAIGVGVSLGGCAGAAGARTGAAAPADHGGDVGVLYERAEYRYITFARFTPPWPRECA